jgi:two-component system chemotaxis response regulator CheY
MRRVLIVEDSASTRAFVRAVLEAPEFAGILAKQAMQPGGGGDAGPPATAPATQAVTVTEATCGFDAMRLLPRGPYDLIITDINMADINGLELIRFIRKSVHHRTTPLLIISTLRAQHDVERGLALGANKYLAKPFTPEELRDACERLLAEAGVASDGDRPSTPATPASPASPPRGA